MSAEPRAASARPVRPRAAVLAEKALEAVIRLSGVSAIVFVAAIFFFVLREAAPVLFSEGFSLRQFLFSDASGTRPRPRTSATARSR